MNILRLAANAINTVCDVVLGTLYLAGKTVHTAWSLLKAIWIVGLITKFASLSLSAALVVGTLSLSATPARAMTVSDPTSYTYYAEQLKQMTQQIETLSENVTQVKNVLSMTQEVRDQMQGVYGMAKGVLEDFENVSKRLKDEPMSILEYLQKYLPKDQQDQFTAPDGAADINKALDEIFKDPRTKDFYIFDEEPKRRAVRQEALRNAITEAEAAIEQIDPRLKTIESLAKQIDSKENENLKSSQDLTSSILVEMLTALREIQTLLSRYTTASMMLQYTGHDEELARKEIEAKRPASRTAAYIKKWNKGATVLEYLK
ncbi:type IV secretion system protein [uncultured Pseudodesulfovibrio sp.]|uniref:type IV secretion system protein n=1 Tax=uncultured Pseudodesulfovibrio sp. TaxID=2035858 RepID=UPI0029C66020|nr:type IV secretion system protein [uncultured Pseudodesulfovibrio sp.]